MTSTRKPFPPSSYGETPRGSLSPKSLRGYQPGSCSNLPHETGLDTHERMSPKRALPSKVAQRLADALEKHSDQLLSPQNLLFWRALLICAHSDGFWSACNLRGGTKFPRAIFTVPPVTTKAPL
ncbi:unnamed protein product, partial [Calicophoron daubneyi]